MADGDRMNGNSNGGANGHVPAGPGHVNGSGPAHAPASVRPSQGPEPMTALVILEDESSRRPTLSMMQGLPGVEVVGERHEEVDEARVAGSTAQQFYNDQLNALANRIRNIAKPGKDASELGVEATKALSSTRAIMQARASKEYDDGINRALTLAAGDVADNFGVRADNVMRTVADMDVPPDSWQKLMGPANAKYAKQILDLSEVLAKNNGAMSMGDMIRLHQAANKLRNGLYKLEQGQEVSPEVYDAVLEGQRVSVGRVPTTRVAVDVGQLRVRGAQSGGRCACARRGWGPCGGTRGGRGTSTGRGGSLGG